MYLKCQRSIRNVIILFLELPLFVETAPVRWALPSYVVVLIQCGNIGSLAYIIYEKWSTRCFDNSHLIYLTLVIGCLAAVCMAFFHQITIEVNGKTHSIAILLFTFMFPLVGCVSSCMLTCYVFTAYIPSWFGGTKYLFNMQWHLFILCITRESPSPICWYNVWKCINGECGSLSLFFYFRTLDNIMDWSARFHVLYEIVNSQYVAVSGLVWAGWITQLDDCIGAIVMFILVNHLKNVRN